MNTCAFHPYISVVIVSRNDDHGSNMFRRMQLCIEGLLYQFEKYKILSELILVEWLPPKDRPLIKDIYPWPDSQWTQIKVIVVTQSMIPHYEYTENFAIRDLTPWNVGVRRARGEFILSTVADELFSNEMMLFFSEKRLKKENIYRIDRCHVNRKVLDLESPTERLAYCKKNIIDMDTLNPLKFLFVRRGFPILHDKAPGDFILMSRDRWHHIRGFPEGVSPGADNLLLNMAYLSGAKQFILKAPVKMYHIDHNSIWKSNVYVQTRKYLLRIGLYYKFVDIISALLCKIIPGESDISKAGINYNSQRANDLTYEMIKRKRSYIYNDEYWGLSDLNIL